MNRGEAWWWIPLRFYVPYETDLIISYHLKALIPYLQMVKWFPFLMSPKIPIAKTRWELNGCVWKGSKVLTKRWCFEDLHCHYSSAGKDSSALTGTQWTQMPSTQYSHFWNYCLRRYVDVHSPWVFLSLTHRLRIRKPGFWSSVILEFLESRKQQL